MIDKIPTSRRKSKFDWSAYGFAKALKLLRRSFLQDSVFLKEEYPDHPVFEHEIFDSREYQEFELSMKEHIKTSMAARRLRSIEEVILSCMHPACLPDCFL